MTIRLERLPDEAVAELVVGVPTALRARIAEAAGGNPLYLTEVLAMAVEGRAIDVPPTLRSLLAARLDELDVPERVILSGARSRASSSTAARSRHSRQARHE